MHTSSNSKNKKPLIVQKYGGATLSTPEKIKLVAQQIHDLHQAGTQIVAVVSAMGDTTNHLISLAHQVSERPSLRELDMLLSVGERMSMSLLSMALNSLGCPAISFTGSQAGILTDESHVNAQIIDVKGFRVEEALAKNLVVIMAGFQGVSPVTKEITTLGRGGSDTSAVAMAAFLHADRCEILKDVDGIYTADPKKVEQAQAIPFLNYSHLIEMTSWGAKVLHHRSVEMAQQKNVTLYVGPAHHPQRQSSQQGTLITSDFQWPQQQAVAINTFQQIFQIELTDEYSDFNSFLNQNQIGRPQFLFAKNNQTYITAPKEILMAIEHFETQQNVYQITNKSLCSLSMTYSQITQNEQLSAMQKTMHSAGIQIHESFQLMNSLHFFINQNEQTKAIQLLHRLCFEK